MRRFYAATARRAASESISRVVPLKMRLMPTSVPMTQGLLEGHVLQTRTATIRVTIPSTSNQAEPERPRGDRLDRDLP